VSFWPRSSPARTLAGWTALDRGSQLQAWQYHEDAKVSAREADSPYLLAHAAAQQAVILLDIGEADAAVELLEYARYVAENRAPSLLRSWLAAAHGEGLAAAGQRDESFRAFDVASSLLPTNPADPAMPFLLLNEGQLTRWRGNALLRLGDPDAITQLEASVRDLANPEWSAVRGLTNTYVDLAFAYAAAGNTKEQCSTRSRRVSSPSASGLIVSGSVSRIWSYRVPEVPVLREAR